MLKAVFFDASETLIHLPRGVAWHYCDVASRHGLTLDESAVRAAFRAAWKGMPARDVTGVPREGDDRPWWRDLVGHVLTRTQGGSAGSYDFEALFADLYAEFTLPGVWELYPEVRPTLDRLAGRYRLGVISNFDRRLRTVLAHLGVLDRFEAVVVSSEAGADKPHPLIFQTALRSLGVAPGEAAHVGDDPERDWAAAEGVGMRAFKLNRPANSLRDLPAWLETAGSH